MSDTAFPLGETLDAAGNVKRAGFNHQIRYGALPQAIPGFYTIQSAAGFLVIFVGICTFKNGVHSGNLIGANFDHKVGGTLLFEQQALMTLTDAQDFDFHYIGGFGQTPSANIGPPGTVIDLDINYFGHDTGGGLGDANQSWEIALIEFL